MSSVRRAGLRGASPLKKASSGPGVRGGDGMEGEEDTREYRDGPLGVRRSSYCPLDSREGEGDRERVALRAVLVFPYDEASSQEE